MAERDKSQDEVPQFLQINGFMSYFLSFSIIIGWIAFMSDMNNLMCELSHYNHTAHITH